MTRIRHPYPEGEEFVTKCDADGCDRHSNECAVSRDDAAGEDRCDRHRALLPIGTRVKVIGDHEWVGPSSHALVDTLGTVVAHDDPYLVVAVDGFPAPEGDDGVLLYPTEVEVVS